MFEQDKENIPMQNVQQAVEKILTTNSPENVLVAFDIDLTLTQPDHPAIYYPTIYKHGHIFKEIMDKLDPAQRDLAITYIIKQPQILVDQAAPNVIGKLQSIGVKTIAFTACTTGHIKSVTGEKVRIEHIRYQTLESFNLNFSNTYPVDEIVFTHMLSHNGNHPSFYKGILFSNGEKDESGKTKKTNKGMVIISFLEKIPVLPEVIVMVDDRKHNLEDIETYLQQHYPKIKFVGIEYKAAYDYAPTDISAEDFRVFWQAMADEAIAGSTTNL